MNIFVLSPHRDDAAFSLSLALIQWLDASHSVTLLNCFTRSVYARFSDADFAHPNDQMSYVSAMRRREDELFLKRLPGATEKNLKMMDLNLKDAALRLRRSEEELCTLGSDFEDPALPKIRKRLSSLTADGDIDALVVPLALGENIDHRTVRAAALPFSACLPCAFFEDLPCPAHAVADVDTQTYPNAFNGQAVEPLVPVFCRVPSGRAIKRRLSLGYASQIDEVTADAISDFSLRYNQGERLWANAAWMSLSPSQRLSTP